MTDYEYVTVPLDDPNYDYASAIGNKPVNLAQSYITMQIHYKTFQGKLIAFHRAYPQRTSLLFRLADGSLRKLFIDCVIRDGPWEAFQKSAVPLVVDHS